MTMHSKISGRTVTATIMLLAICFAEAGVAQEHKIYRCKVADVLSLSHDGRLSPDKNPKTLMRQLFDGSFIDTLTGAITSAGGGRAVWQIVQEGSGVNDYVLVQKTSSSFPPDMRASAAATDFIRLRAWKDEPTVRFLVFSLSTVASGPCEVVR